MAVFEFLALPFSDIVRTESAYCHLKQKIDGPTGGRQRAGNRKRLLSSETENQFPPLEDGCGNGLPAIKQPTHPGSGASGVIASTLDPIEPGWVRGRGTEPAPAGPLTSPPPVSAARTVGYCRLRQKYPCQLLSFEAEDLVVRGRKFLLPTVVRGRKHCRSRQKTLSKLLPANANLGP